MTRSTGRILSVWLLFAVVAGCAHAPPIRDDMSFPERQNLLTGLTDWNLSGRIAVNTGQEAFQGRFTWRQDAQSLDLLIRGPLGAGVLEISGPKDRLMVRARGETLELTDPETELSGLVGWWVPVESFGSWLLGIPDRRYEAAAASGPGDALESLEQRDWRIEYASYQIAQGVLLPRRIDLAHREIELRVSIDRWNSIGMERSP
ncbi:MAG TPA: lipoprotein insertase outer membrane protein LolB [Gammaproteobacteria bacterium]